MRQVCFLFIMSMTSIASLCFAATTKESNMTNPKNPTVLIKTSAGDITVELFADKAPISTKNFLEYTKEGHYNHTIFHRVIGDFMIQGGGFTKDMEQKPTKAPIQNEADNGLSNKKGTIAMARTGEVNSATAQFFINTVDNPFLDFKSKNPREYGYAVFGQVIEGMPVIEKIRKEKTGTKGPFENVPVNAVEIIEVKQLS